MLKLYMQTLNGALGRKRKALRSAVVMAAVGALLAPAAAAVGAPDPAPERRLLVPSEVSGEVRLESRTDVVGALARIEMERGKAQAVRTSFRVKRVAVGNPEILDVIVLSPRELQFVAHGLGATNVLVWSDKGRLEAVIDAHVGTATSQLSSALHRALGNDDLVLESVGDSVVLRGSVPSPLALEHTLKVARALLPSGKRDRVINLLEVSGGHQVMLEVIVAEMSRQLKRELGTNFHTITSSDGTVFEFFNFLDNLIAVDERTFLAEIPGFELSELSTLLSLSQDVTFAGTGFGVGTGLYEFFFKLLEREGLAKVLAEPTLVARSGETASFLVGGEVPIPISQGGASLGSITVIFKPFGVGLSFTPTVLSSDRIHLRVTPEISEPNFALGTSVGGTAVPGFDTRRATTTIELGDGQSFVIAGLLSERVNEVVSKYPLLGNLPVLGVLFRSTSFQREETELVMLVTPRIVKPLPPGPHPLPTDHFIEPSAFEFYLLGRLEARAESPPPPSAPAGSTALPPDGLGGIIGGVGHRVAASHAKETE